jgi:hypothetical protein
MPAARDADVNRSIIGSTAAIGLASMPLAANHPSGWQKSFCMSTTSNAVVATSMSTACGVAASETTRCFFLGRTKLNLWSARIWFMDRPWPPGAPARIALARPCKPHACRQPGADQCSHLPLISS